MQETYWGAKEAGPGEGESSGDAVMTEPWS